MLSVSVAISYVFPLPLPVANIIWPCIVVAGVYSYWQGSGTMVQKGFAQNGCSYAGGLHARLAYIQWGWQSHA